MKYEETLLLNKINETTDMDELVYYLNRLAEIQNVEVSLEKTR